MKRINLYLSAIMIVLLSMSMGCKSTTVITTGSSSSQIPPGQMKKMTGAKSAKQYAPGQQKKNKKNKH